MPPGQIVLTAIAVVLVGASLVVLFNRMKTARMANMALTLVPPAGEFVAAAGRQFHVVEKGEGPAIVFVHGLGGNLRHFDVPLWPHMPAGYRMVAYDRRGYGYSQQDWGNDGRIVTHAGDVVALMDALRIDKAVLVGHSMGGAVSLAAALDHPDRVAGLALLSPLTHLLGRLPPEFGMIDIQNRFLRRFLAHTFAVPQAIRMTDETLSLVFGPQKPPQDFAVGGGALVGVLPNHFYATSTDAVSIGQDLPGLEARYGEIAVPTGILFGTADRVLDHQAQGNAMAGRIKGIELEFLDGVGHMPQYAEPGKVAAFIDRIAKRAFAS